MTARIVVFSAPCPGCGREARWQQDGDETVVHPEDFTVDCECAAAA